MMMMCVIEVEVIHQCFWYWDINAAVLSAKDTTEFFFFKLSGYTLLNCILAVYDLDIRILVRYMISSLQFRRSEPVLVRSIKLDWRADSACFN